MRNAKAWMGALGLLAMGCGDDSPRSVVPWSEQRTQVIDSDRKAIEVGPALDDKGCLDYRGTCLKPQEKCGSNGADIVLDSKGQLLDFICYPGEATLTVDEVAAQKGDIAQNQNNTVILLDDLDDEADIQGDVSVDANNVVIYGENADRSVIAGNLTLDGNNGLVRGVRITGNVDVVKNNNLLALCVIEGNLQISANNVEIVGCDIFGTVTVTGNNVKLLGNRIAGTLSSSGKGAACEENFVVADANANRIVDDGEVGAALACD